MVKVSQQLHLSERSQAEHAMIKWRDLLDGDFLAGRLMECRADGLTQSVSSGIPQNLHRSEIREKNIPDNPVCTLTDNILDLVLVANVERDFPRGRSVSRHFFPTP